MRCTCSIQPTTNLLPHVCNLPHLVDAGGVVILFPHRVVVLAVAPQAVGVVPEEAGGPAMQPLLAGEQEVLDNVPGCGTTSNNARERDNANVKKVHRITPFVRLCGAE